ncbi:MAG: T9SS type A sorting domain-containing protein, partial [Saprospiraceae bacterium]|nr:T9SS type A sorting domain-containing protein [Saprospiraceae bacterium]
FTFNDIQLPGLNQSPQASPELAQGYIYFGLEPIPCVKKEGGADFFITKAAVTFLAPSINFSETLNTNPAQQAFGPCNPDMECAIDRSAQTTFYQLSEPRCYPTLFQEVLNVEVPAQPTPEKMEVVLMNLNGQTIEKHLVHTVAGDATYLRLNTSELNNGMYLVRLVQGDQISTFKVVKQ